MKILPKKVDIDKAKAQERKREVDAGMALATKVDALRRTLVEEEKKVSEYRTNAIKSIQQEIDSYLEVKEHLRQETEKAEVYRKKLIEPLDAEWAEVNQMKAQISEKLSLIDVQFYELQKKEEGIKETEEHLSKEWVLIQESKTDALNITKDAEEFKEKARIILQESVQKGELQDKEYAKRREEIEKLEIQYTEHIKAVNELSEKLNEQKQELEQKESDIINKEKYLKEQQIIVQVAEQVIKNNGYSMSTNDER